MTSSIFSFFFFFNDTATTEIYTLSLHDALPICGREPALLQVGRAPYGQVNLSIHPRCRLRWCPRARPGGRARFARSEEHTSELQSHLNLVCRLLLEKKKTIPSKDIIS